MAETVKFLKEWKLCSLVCNISSELDGIILSNRCPCFLM